MASLTDKQRAFIDHYIVCGLNATEAARRAGYKNPRQMASETLSKPYIREAIDKRLRATTLSADEVLSGLDQQARADVGTFFKIVEEWTFYPLPLDDVLDAEEVLDDSDPKEERLRVSYLVRRVSIDPEKIIDPQYSHLLHKVSDTPRGGLTIELYSKQRALELLGKYYALFTDKVKTEDWHDTALEYIKTGQVTYKALADEFGADLATELFTLAGVPVQVGTGAN